uniref:probable ATP-dependent RNA helicase DHX58 isoform X2 n=1 Tax=Myodes glareolus TaxID=447135 RepID=UPI002021A6B4|nr:probable ATP-dependent RNA helicase DHX58 isoform X2 [Myodes glareolus]
MELRPYQWEVILPALEGKNIIIWLPTGGGKTRAAAFVARRHLETVDKGKVVVLVNRVHLVSQHAEEFRRMLDKQWTMTTLSGDMGPRAGFGLMARSHDLLICTAELLQLALVSPEDEEHVELTEFSLIVVDECHHTHKDTVYNVILSRYLEHKLQKAKRLPQVLGLTASPGTGGATKLQGAIDHILQLCANLDTWRIMSPENCRPQLLEHNPKPCKQYNLCQRRKEDPFGDFLKELMKQIHQQLEMPELSQQFGTQTYEQQVVELSKAGSAPRKLRCCVLSAGCWSCSMVQQTGHLNSEAVGTPGSLGFAGQFILSSHKNELAQLAARGPENPKLEMLEEILLKQFGSPNHPRGIIFTRTRQSACSLLLWLWQQPGLQNVNIKAQMLIGAGNTSQSTHMTQKDQREVIQEFRDGTLNLLVATSVAEEGLDIAQCNVVVRYGLLTNEISMVQARGRARAGQSVYSFVATEGSRELQRELTNEALEVLMEQAVAEVQKMDPQEFKAKIQDLQQAALVKRAVRAAQRESQQRQFPAERVQLLCINCMVAVGYGSDLRKVEGTHHVNVNPNFSVYYTVSQKPVVINKVFKDWRPGGTISCNNCGEVWGLQMIYKSVTLPVLKIRGILLETPHGRIQAKKWSRVPFSIPDFDILQYCAQNLSDLSLD